MNSIKKKKNMTKLILILLCTTIIVSCLTLSKYQSANASKVTMQIAKVALSSNIDEIILEDMEPGDIKNYYFEVGSEEERDVAMMYTIKLKTGSYLPLSFEVRKVESGEDTNEVLGENLLETGNVTSEINMPTTDETHKYKLIVKWDEDEKNYKFNTEIDYVNIIINAYQVNVNE